MSESRTYDVITLGAGAAGLFFAAEAGRRGKRVVVIDHAKKIGEKIRISGGGRCNFTNIHTKPENFLSQNPKFAISALRGFTPQDFIGRVEKAGIAWHEKKLGQLFCDDSAQQIIDMLVDDCRAQGVVIRMETAVEKVSRDGEIYHVSTDAGTFTAPALVVATGGKSIPKIGATGLGYQLAEQFGLDIIEPRPALVPLTFSGDVLEMTKGLAGVSVEARVSADPETQFGKRKAKRRTEFSEGFLFTHRGLSGPSILQISSYWREGGSVTVNLSPEKSVYDALRQRRAAGGKVEVHTALGEVLPKRLATSLAASEGWRGNLADWSDAKIDALAQRVHGWAVKPAGSEGYRTAEVTLGGVDTNGLNSRTMEANSVPGLYFIGEVVDVTGWLGGYNFQWAWASGFAAAQAV
ncbi:NAD(P)/FAD-dependent oxidoreductase [Parvularcula sp. ZS-1/3]|uniref:NAD(P)/FAD-dependent oxidoreductase n=1 Tax=Parvularcula mediterranea TaxID=2732508 RepID=A0A7Y3RJY3_9PROT|nr:NAD(P)/FAD-dependent oxidoreductase [Parvularcula mediterranea]